MRDQKSSLGHRPVGAWSFDAGVARCFDDMAARSIPLYRETLDLMAHFAARRLREDDVVVDLGTATGQMLEVLDRRLDKIDPCFGVRMIGIDNSPEMLEKARESLPADAEVLEHDLRLGLPPRVIEARPRVIFCLWTAQFIPIEYRARLYRDCRRAIAEGGALFVAEKLRGQTAAHQEDLVAVYHDWKNRSGYSVEEIRAKAESLEGRLVPNDAPGQKAMLMREGWSVEEVVRYLGFAAWQCLPVGASPPGPVG